jgi:hypothetical protein
MIGSICNPNSENPGFRPVGIPRVTLYKKAEAFQTVIKKHAGVN